MSSKDSAQDSYPPSDPYQTIFTKFCEPYTTLSSASSLTAIRAPNCTISMSPKSANPPPPLTNEQYGSYFASLKAIMAGFPVTPLWTSFNRAEGIIAAHVEGRPLFYEELKKEGEEDWEYVGDYMWVLWLDEKREMVEKVLEFVDSKGMEVYMGLVERAKGRREELIKKGEWTRGGESLLGVL